jgi:hypothetical protein
VRARRRHRRQRSDGGVRQVTHQIVRGRRRGRRLLPQGAPRIHHPAGLTCCLHRFLSSLDSFMHDTSMYVITSYQSNRTDY